MVVLYVLLDICSKQEESIVLNFHGGIHEFCHGQQG